MKKNIYLLIMFALGMHIIQAKPVTPLTARNLATSFYKQHSTKVPQTLTLAYTETSPTGEALYYVFNVNQNDGFVIITADDAAHPIIGYSTERKFVVPEANTGIGFWMKGRKRQIMAIKASNPEATADIAREWAGDFSAASNLTNASQRTSTPNSISSYTVGSYLVQSTWNQSGGGAVQYNHLCPGTGSNQAVTGCVATTMAQIMRFWSYPTHGIGSHSYCDCTADGFTVNNGTLTVNFAAVTYSWTAMSYTASNTSVANLMYDCGVSVDMNYSPSGSGAQVLSVDAPSDGACAQQSYTLHYGYNSSTIAGYQRNSGFTDAAWISLIETDIAAGRPVQYAGQDSSEGDGHTWVCDGYDGSNNLHMNWGWAGSDDGFFSVNNLLTTNAGFDPQQDNQVLVGIEPPPSVDAGISTIIAPTGVLCAATFTPMVTINNFGQNTLTTCQINYQLDANTVQTYTWTGSLVTGASANVSLPAITTTVGSHSLTATTNLPNNTTDGNLTNNSSATTFIYATVGATLPLIEGFEGSSNLPADWSTSQAANDVPWQVVTTIAHTGSNCVGFNDCDGDGATDMTGFKEWLYTPTYDFSSATTGTMKFDVGYIPVYAPASGTVAAKVYSDTLAVYYSVNCGTTWTQIYKKGGVSLGTAPTYTITGSVYCVNPTSSQWRTDSVVVAALAGQPNVEFAFENISDWGDWLYIDNINITATNSTTGISKINNGGLMVYPNPAHSNLFINTTENTTSVSVTDIIGQTVISDIRVTPQQTQSIDISSLADGVYLVKVNSSDSQVKVIRFIKN